MPTVEVSLPDKVDNEINRLVEQGEFLNRDQAIEELLSMGVSAYDTTDSAEDTFEDPFTGTLTDQRDPAMDEEAGEDYTF